MVVILTLMVTAGQAKLLKQPVMRGLLEAIESAFGNLEVGEALLCLLL